MRNRPGVEEVYDMKLYRNTKTAVKCVIFEINRQRGSAIGIDSEVTIDSSIFLLCFYLAGLNE